MHVALALDRPLLLEGEPGVGKTEIARVLAAVLGRELIRLQCYEGIDTHQALYEWDHARQLLAIRALGDRGRLGHRALRARVPPRTAAPARAAHRVGAVLLIDEIDRADDEFEAFLLEMLSDFQITIPEVGTVTAPTPPLVVLTSNRTRELHDALKRRCLYHWIDYPDAEREVEIVTLRQPGVAGDLARAWSPRSTACASWSWPSRPASRRRSTGRARSTCSASRTSTPDAADLTLGSVLKEREDLELAREHLDEITPRA